MCYFVTFATNAPITEIAIPKRILLSEHIEDTNGHSYPNLRYVWGATRGGCSCDLVNPADLIAAQTARDSKRLARLRQSYERKDWSDTKIERAISNNSKSKEHKAAGRSSRNFEPEFGTLLDHVLETNGYLELIVHWHSGDFFGEAFDISETVKVSSEKPSQLEGLTADTRYTWSRQ